MKTYTIHAVRDAETGRWLTDGVQLGQQLQPLSPPIAP